MNEFSLIDRYFKSLPIKRPDVLLGIGDDAACLQTPKGMNLIVSTDTLVSGVHFLPEWDAYDIAYKAVMANVSDMAAMAAEPCWLTLALTLPELNEQWLESFRRGLSEALNQFNIDLVGGDTTKGALTITMTIMGFAPSNQIVRRDGAKSGDVILVSGALGAAALAVSFLNKQGIVPSDRALLMDALLHPKPRVDLVHLLRLYATAAIDISDGLSADLDHICTASGLGACINRNAIPLHSLLPVYLGDKAVDLALTGGDDYELCFTVPALKLDSFMSEMKQAGMVCYPIGHMEPQPGLRIRMEDNRCDAITPGGYVHF
ncbi:MAG: thiamine-phosphate kinase [Legionellales bacterium]